MQKLFCFLILSLFPILAVAQNTTGSLKFPDDFYLKKEETPPGFALEAIDEKAKAVGFLTNPSLVRVSEFADGLYPNADVSKMKQMLMTIFKDKNPEGMNIDVVAVEYKSTADLERELPKFTTNQELKFFLMKDNYLVIASGDLTGSYRKAVDKLSTQLASRLGLKRLEVREEFVPEPEPVAVPVPAQ